MLLTVFVRRGSQEKLREEESKKNKGKNNNNNDGDIEMVEMVRILKGKLVLLTV